MITQSKIAEMVGVSRATVERVLNNRGDVSDATRKRVLEIAQLMEYRPNRAGKTLAIQHKKLKIGCIIIQADNPFYAELNKGIQAKAEEYKAYGIEIIVESAVFKAEEQIKMIDLLLEKSINALVIQPANEPLLADKLKEVEELGLPIVTVNTDLPDYNSSFCYVGNDFYLCGRTAANLMELFTNGICRIGIITGFFNAKSHSDRVDGFKGYIQDIPGMRIIDIAENQDDELESYYVTKTMLERHPEIDAMFLVAGGVQGAGKAIRDLPAQRRPRVISFDDVLPTRALVRDGIILATICQQPVRQGELSLEVLFNYLVDDLMPANNRIYTDIQIKIKTNIDG
ncbi:MAG: LacI family DNA-binding transcriptional regulator [Lachnospiraceae bacterium]